MCSIIGSFNPEVLKQLIKLNQFRGDFSYSYTSISNNQVINQIKNFGEFDLDIIEDNDSVYKLCHVQAPTGGLVRDINRVHPVKSTDDYLWHNGLLTSRGIKYCQKELCTDKTFDTELLLDMIKLKGFSVLSSIEGMFSCVLIKENKMYMFRTKHGKLYIDADMNISSERFESSKCINSDTVYQVDLNNKEIRVENKFKTKRFNVMVEGELDE